MLSNKYPDNYKDSKFSRIILLQKDRVSFFGANLQDTITLMTYLVRDEPEEFVIKWISDKSGFGDYFGKALIKLIKEAYTNQETLKQISITGKALVELIFFEDVNYEH